MPKDTTIDGVAASFEVGKGGPRVKNGAGSLQGRNNADTAFVTCQGDDPVVADDFTTKRYVDAQLGALPSLDLYEAASGTAIGLAPTWVAIPMDTQRQIDTAQFTHTGPAADFTWAGASGTKVRILGRFTVTGPAQTVSGRITINTGAAFTNVVGSSSSAELTASGQATVVLFAILTLNNGDKVRIEGQGTGAAAPTLVANSSGLEASSLKNANAAAGGGGAGFPYVELTQTTLAAISAKSITTPDAFWDFKGRLTELTVGGTGRDLIGDVQGPNFALVDGQDGETNEVWGFYFCGQNGGAEVDNPTLFKNRDNLTIAYWYDSLDTSAQNNTDRQIMVTYASTTTTTVGSTTAPPYRFGFTANRGTSNGPGRQLAMGWWDNVGGGTHYEALATINGLRASINMAGRYHLAFTRTKVGDLDYDIQMYVNGKPFGPLVNVPRNPGDPSSVNMRFIVGSGRNGSLQCQAVMWDLAYWNSVRSAAEIENLYKIGIGE